MTENTISTTFNRWDDPPEIIYQNKAPILADCEVAIVDPETGAQLPTGQDGEIWCRGDTVMRGYYDNPEATREAITPAGWLRTGDIGRFDEAGYLSITGRRKEMFKIGGTNAYPGRDRAAYRQAGRRRDVGGRGRAGRAAGRGGIRLRAGRGSRDAFGTGRDRSLPGRIADYKVPRYVRLVEDFPRTPSGKIKKFELAEIARRDVQSCAAKA